MREGSTAQVGCWGMEQISETVLNPVRSVQNDCLVTAAVRFIRENERKRLTGLSRSTWWRMEKQGLAPKRRQLSPNSTGWLPSELYGWMQSRQAA
jgi:prophage regulatory protein